MRQWGNGAIRGMNLYDIDVVAIDGTPHRMDRYRGKTLLVVNVASQCGYTPQYEGLEALYRKYQDRGLVVLGFPCNQFGRQEPGTDADIQAFCSLMYDVTFPLFSRIDVNGPRAHPLYTFLKAQKKGLVGSNIRWNFSKFLLASDGTVIKRYGPRDTPAKIEAAIVSVLADH
jgi:glutathione peroxidase